MRIPRRYLVFAGLVAPAILLRLFTAVYPFIRTAYLSFVESSFGSPDTFVGLKNFQKLLLDPGVKSSISFTVVFTLVSALLIVAIAYPVALLLNARFTGRRLTRTINLIPWAIPTIVAAFGFRWLLDDQYGMITDWIFRLTGNRLAPLVNPGWAQFWVIFVNVWKNIPFVALLILAGLQGVPAEVYEAAKIDGAGAVRTFFRITLPLTIPVVATFTIFNIVWMLGSFDLIYGMTQGGPGVATSVLGYRIFEYGILHLNFGTASALGMVLVLIVAIVGVAGLRILKRMEVQL